MPAPLLLFVLKLTCHLSGSCNPSGPMPHSLLEHNAPGVYRYGSQDTYGHGTDNPIIGEVAVLSSPSPSGFVAGGPDRDEDVDHCLFFTFILKPSRQV